MNRSEGAHFSGSYLPDDVEFLLRPLEMQPLSMAEREKRVINNEAHYSEMIGRERPPELDRLRIFRRLYENSRDDFAQQLAVLARGLSRKSGPLAIVSIARAGTPVGVILKKLLQSAELIRDVAHYSISVIRDFGVDLAALSLILKSYPPESLVFVDGWTGKGTIARELEGSLIAAGKKFSAIDPGLWVPVDMSGMAAVSASREDRIIPSAVLGGTISGLLSRSILPKHERGKEQMHGCLILADLKKYDLSRWFVDEMFRRALPLLDSPGLPPTLTADLKTQTVMDLFVADTVKEFRLGSVNHLKIGLGESVRAAIRRMPKEILIRDPKSTWVAPLVDLAILRKIPLKLRPEIPVEAVAILT